MRLWVLGSGSRGNAIVLECDGSRVLVDAGFPPRVLAARLAAIGIAPESIEALLITHEHTDHVKGACAGAKRWGWAVYATHGTVSGCADLVAADVRTFDAGGTVTLGRMDVRSVRTPHDAAESVALVATSHTSGTRVGIAYDLGQATPAVRTALRDLDVLVLESNHDDGMLNAGPYPPSVRERIASRFGHLSNRDASQLARESVHPGLGHVVLAHLSEKCNDPRLACSTVAGSLTGTRFRGALSAAAQDRVVGPFAPRVRRTVAVQLELL